MPLRRTVSMTTTWRPRRNASATCSTDMRAIVHPHGRLLTASGMVFRVALGRAGVRADKQEGDGATPVGLMPLRRVLYRADRVRAPECAVPTEPLAPDDAWCDDIDRPEYNQMIRIPHDGHY